MERMQFQGHGGISLIADAFGSPGDPAVLLLPSIAQTRDYWHPAANALAAAGRQAICIDMRGHGESGRARDGDYSLDAYIADVRSVLGSLPSRATVIGSGLSALVAMVATAESAPHLVSGLVLVDTTIWFDPAIVERLTAALARRAEPFTSPEAVIDAIAASHPDEPRPARKELLLRAYCDLGTDGLGWRGDPRALIASELRMDEDRLLSAARKVSVPVMLLRGAENTSVTAEATARLSELLTDCETAEIEGVGHHGPILGEDGFNAILLDFLERRAPRAPLRFIGGSEPRTLRDALGCFGTGVTVVTSFDPNGEPIGLTANSFTSVSLDPPLILFALAKTSGNLEAFQSAGRFAVNVVHIGQQPQADRFARRDGPRFQDLDWEVRSDGGSPILPQSLASFDCRTWAVNEGGDHLIFIGEVKQAWYEPNRDPLLYFRGKYRRLHFA